MFTDEGLGYDGAMDLTTASRDELIALVGEQQAALAAQQATIATLRAAVAQLEQRVRELEAGPGRPQGMPGHKPEQCDPAAAVGGLTMAI